jgi:hypothetical protein
MATPDCLSNARSVAAPECSKGSRLRPASSHLVNLGLGEIDQVFTCLEHAIDDRDPIIVPIKTDPILDPLRTDPRFAVLLRNMNLEY